MSTEPILESVEPDYLNTNAKPLELPGSARETSITRGWRRVVNLAFAGLFFVLGLAGAILPALPATPFLLLTSYFLVRSSPRLNRKLLRSRVFGPILVDWQVHGGVRLHVKARAVVVVVLTVAFTIYMSGYSVALAAVIIALAAAGIAMICRLPEARDKGSLPLSARPAADRTESA